jgi:transposase-like protein
VQLLIQRPASPRQSAFAGFRFPSEVIVVAVRWYLRYNLSYRDVEELLLERGVEVDHVTVFRWVQRFTPLLADAAKFTRHAPCDRWFVDETYVKVGGVWRYVYRAVDQYGQVVDVLFSPRRDAAAARRFFRRALKTLKVTPSEVVTDAAAVYPAVLDELIPSACHHVEHHVERYAGQPDRSRSQLAEAPAGTDARPAHRPNSRRDHGRARLHSESSTRPLRTGTRRTVRVAARRCIHRTGPGDLTKGRNRGSVCQRT